LSCMKSTQMYLCCINEKICDTNWLELHVCETRKVSGCSFIWRYKFLYPQIKSQLTDMPKNTHQWNSAGTLKSQEVRVKLVRKVWEMPERIEEVA